MSEPVAHWPSPDVHSQERLRLFVVQSSSTAVDGGNLAPPRKPKIFSHAGIRCSILGGARFPPVGAMKATALNDLNRECAKKGEKL